MKNPAFKICMPQYSKGIFFLNEKKKILSAANACIFCSSYSVFLIKKKMVQNCAHPENHPCHCMMPWDGEGKRTYQKFSNCFLALFKVEDSQYLKYLIVNLIT